MKQADQTYFVIKDPITNRFFRFRQPEYFIARQLDGQTGLEEIRHRFLSEFSVDLPSAGLHQFVQRLHGLGFTERGLTERELSQLQRNMSDEQGRLRKFLSFKLKTVDPDGFLGAILPHARFLFTKPFALLVVALTIAAAVTVISGWRDYYSYAPRLFRAGTIPTLMIVTILVASLHEMAHGLTCRHFGGHVHEMGFLVLYFMPGLYCGVSDAWLFNDKNKRMWVSSAGMFFQMFIGSLAAIAWRLTGHATLLGDVWYITMVVCALTILFNLNPLIKLDGYYLLSDYLDIPNLRKAAFGYLSSRIWGGRHANLGARAPIAGREKNIYTFYGLSAVAFSIALVVLFFRTVIGFFIGGTQ